MVRFPVGTVTFYLTDVERSTRRWGTNPDETSILLRRYEALVARTVAAHRGRLVKRRAEGDSTFAVFSRASDAVAAALALQEAAVDAFNDAQEPFLIRAALHAGEAEYRDRDYFGLAPSVCARVRDSAHGGQTVLTETVRDLVSGDLHTSVHLSDLGRYGFRDVTLPLRIYQLDGSGQTGTFPPLKSSLVPLTNVRRELSSFVGRNRELSDLALVLEDSRLVTLTGAGGTGKTRLANELAVRILGRFMDGIWEVELADLDDGVLLARAVATVMGLSDQPGHSTAEVVIEYLRHREVLLILDNCEHLVHAIGPFVDELLQSCLALRVLLTSRKSLLIYGERKFEVTPLPVPPDVAEVTAVDVWEFDAARLFVERARERTSRFEFTDASAPSVAQVCRSVAGMPLAIELAAARLTVLSVEEIAVQVSESIRVLGTDLRGRVLRHKSLRAAMDWSYEWLGPVEQVVLCQLGVFRGSFDLDAARSVTTFDTSDDLTLEDIVAALLESSMLTAVASLGGHARFRLLEPIRHYAYEKLELTPDALAAASRRHADHYLRVAESLEPALMGPNRSTALEILDSAQDNLQSALRWTLAAELTGPALRLAAAPWRYWYIRGRLREGRQSLDRALALATRESSVQPELRAKALYAAGTLTSYLGEYDAARERLEESVDLFRALHDRDGMMRALNNLGITAFEQGDYAGALRLYQESMELHRQLNDPARLAISLVNLAGAAAEVGDLSLARRYAAESLAISRDMGDTLGVAPSLATLAVISGYEGDRETAMRLARDCLEISQALGSRQGVAEALRLIGQFAHEEGDLRHARSVFEESLAIERDIGNSRSIASMLRYLGEVAYDEGDLQEAIRMFRESRDICQQIGRRRGRVDALIGLGRALCRKGHLAEATLTLGEAMHVAHELDHERTLLLVIESHALLADRLDDPERTLRLASFAEAWRAAAGMPVSPIRGAEIAEVVRSARARLTPSAADGATASGRSLTLAQAIKQATSAEW